MNLNELAREAHRTAEEKGWWGTKVPAEMIPEKLLLIHSEVSEALEDYRANKMRLQQTSGGKPVGFPSELADIIIRVADLANALEIDLDEAIKIKMAYNKTRSHRHGGKRV